MYENEILTKVKELEAKPKEIVIDAKLCDKPWRVNNLYKIIDKEKNLVAFSLNKVQQLYEEGKWKRNIILKARQLGITTYECVDMLDDALFNRNFNAVIISHDKESVTKIFKKVKLAWDHFELKDAMGFSADYDSKSELTFNNGSSIRVVMSSRSDTVNRLHISEFGKICAKYPARAEEIITGAIPSVPLDGRIDIESTAEGETGHFHDMFWESWETEPQSVLQFKSHFFPWTLEEKYRIKEKVDVPENFLDYATENDVDHQQITWYYLTWRTQREKMKREFPTTPTEAFEASGNKFFDIDVIKFKIDNEVKVPETVGDWSYFADYKPNHTYALASDVAEGLGLDSSTAVILDFSMKIPEVVAVYESNKIAPDILAFELKNGATRYGNCLVAVERNNHGLATLTKLKEIYHNLYTEQRFDKMSNERTERLGWLTTSASKPRIFYDLKTALNEDEVIIPDKRILHEMRLYDVENVVTTKFDEFATNHFDLLTALAICWELRKEVSYTPGGMAQPVKLIEEPLFNKFKTVQ